MCWLVGYAEGDKAGCATVTVACMQYVNDVVIGAPDVVTEELLDYFKVQSAWEPGVQTEGDSRTEM